MPFSLEQFVNFVQTTLSTASLDPDATSMTVASATGIPTNGQIRALLQSATDQTKKEIVLVTQVSGTTLSIQRRVELVAGSAPRITFVAGDTVQFIFTAGNVTNDPRSMSAPGDLETLNADGQ